MSIRPAPLPSPTGLSPARARFPNRFGSRLRWVGGLALPPDRSHNPACTTGAPLTCRRFRLTPFRSPLLGGSWPGLPPALLLSFPPATKMVQFTGCPPRTSRPKVTGHHSRRVSPFGYLGIYACLQLPRAFRRWLRPSSALGPKASSPCLTFLSLSARREVEGSEDPSLPPLRHAFVRVLSQTLSLLRFYSLFSCFSFQGAIVFAAESTSPPGSERSCERRSPVVLSETPSKRRPLRGCQGPQGRPQSPPVERSRGNGSSGAGAARRSRSPEGRPSQPKRSKSRFRETR